VNETIGDLVVCGLPLRILPIMRVSWWDEDGDGEPRDGETEVWFWVRPDGVAADIDRRLLASLAPWLRDDFAFSRVLYRARAGDARHTGIFGEAGLQFVETRSRRGVEDLLFA
jgi:hypothetical protein